MAGVRLQKLFYYIIGDIHGCYDELITLEKKIYIHAKKNNARVVIISTGDLVDRGPDSAKVVEHFIQGQKNKTHFAVIGNHEYLMLLTLEGFHPEWWGSKTKTNQKYPFFLPKLKDFYSDDHKTKNYLAFEDYVNRWKGNWIDQGGKSTLESYKQDTRNPKSWKIPARHINYLSQLPLYLEFDDFFVTHALPDATHYPIAKKFVKGNRNQKLSRAIEDSIQTLLWNREPTNLFSVTRKINISGHTPCNEPLFLNKKHFLIIDTCAFGGNALTAWCMNTKTFFKIKSRKYYTKP